MLDWVITSLIYDTVILLIYSNVRKKQMTLLEIVLTILVIFIADHGWFYFIVIKFLFLILPRLLQKILKMVFLFRKFQIR